MIKKKEGSKMKKVGKYFREVSVVIIGVTITLIATNWINSRGEQQDLQLYLDAVKLELEDNLVLLRKAESYMDLTLDYSYYLASNKPEEYSVDTLDKYKPITQNYYFFIYKTGAFDMLKTSGAMRLLEDKGLLLDIWNSYSSLELYRAEHDDYMRRKVDALEEAISRNKDVASVDIGDPNQRPLRNFYLTYSSIGDLDSCIAQVTKTLTRFK